ncbi:MAG: hypothetical protein ACRCUF_16985, partial [Aeromonas sobria]
NEKNVTFLPARTEKSSAASRIIPLIGDTSTTLLTDNLISAPAGMVSGRQRLGIAKQNNEV